jgi:hypothetical protein
VGENNYIIGDEFRREWERLRNKVDSLRGDGVTNNPRSISIKSTGGSVAPTVSKNSAAILVLKVTGNASGAGEYNARSVTGACTADPSANLTAPPTGMTVATADDLLFLNLPEAGTTMHAIPSGTFAAGIVVGATSETTPRRIVWGFTGPTIPTPTALYQALVVSAFSSTTNYTLLWDWIRAHA